MSKTHRLQFRARAPLVLVLAALGAGSAPALAAPPSTTRVSVDSFGAQSAGESALTNVGAVLSANGQLVAFASAATNLVAGDTNGRSDVFLHDRRSGATTRVDLSSPGDQADAGAFHPAISADGRFVAFDSVASNLVPGDANGEPDVFERDLETGTTTRVSVAGDGTGRPQESILPAISADGRFVVFWSAAALTPDDTNDQWDVYEHDRATGATVRISVPSGGGGSAGTSVPWSRPAVSGDGTRVAFASNATDLVTGDGDEGDDVFLRDVAAGTTTRVNVTSAGGESSHGSNASAPAISADGRVVAFASDATNLVSGDTNLFEDVFVHDVASGATERVSVTSTGAQATGALIYGSDVPSLSADGRLVAFASDASNLVDGDSNGTPDIFVHDRQTGVTRRENVDSAGDQVADTGYSVSPFDTAISATGRFVAFSSSAPGLVADDTNGRPDAFVRDDGGDAPPAAAIEATPGSGDASLRVHVDGSASADGDGWITGYSWTFGDGASASGAAGDHEYAAAGTYTITLTVTDDDGVTATASRSLTVQAPPGGGGTPLPAPSQPGPPPPPAPPAPPPPAVPGVAHCIVPALHGLTVARARVLLARHHCRLGTQHHAWSTRVRAGRVLSQGSRAGRKLAAGVRISVVVSRGRRPRGGSR